MAATEATAYLHDGVLRVIGTDESEWLVKQFHSPQVGGLRSFTIDRIRIGR